MLKGQKIKKFACQTKKDSLKNIEYFAYQYKVNENSLHSKHTFNVSSKANMKEV